MQVFWQEFSGCDDGGWEERTNEEAFDGDAGGGSGEVGDEPEEEVGGDGEGEIDLEGLLAVGMMMEMGEGPRHTKMASFSPILPVTKPRTKRPTMRPSQKPVALEPAGRGAACRTMRM